MFSWFYGIANSYYKRIASQYGIRVYSAPSSDVVLINGLHLRHLANGLGDTCHVRLL